MGEKLKFQQRWEFRGRDNESDSSSDEMKSSSSGHPTLKKHKLVSGLVSAGNAETSDTSRLPQKDNNDPGIPREIKPCPGNAKRGRRGRTTKDNVGQNQTKRGSRNQKKRKASAYEHAAAFDELKKYMDSLIEDLKVARENLMTWMKEEMHKLVGDETSSKSERRGDAKAEKVKLQQQDNSPKNALVQYQNNFVPNLQVHHQNNFDEYELMQKESNGYVFEENTEMQNPKNFQEKIQLQQLQQTFGSPTRAQNCNGGYLDRFGKSNKSVDPNNFTLAVGDQVDYSQAIVPVTPTERDREERLILSAKSKSSSKSSLSDQNVKVQPKKSIVLGIRAQSCNGGSSERSKGKKTADSNNTCSVTDQVDYIPAMESIASSEKDKRERLGMGLSIDPLFSYDSSSPLASSMYLTLPSVLTKPLAANHRLDTSSFNGIQQRLAGNQTAMNAERSNLIIGSSSNHGYFQDERSRSFAQMTPRDISYFNQNSTGTSIIGNGCSVPLHQPLSGSFSLPSQVGMENLPRENHTLGLRMNGGAIRFSGSLTLPEHFIANNFHNLANYKADGRITAYQDGSQFPK